MDGSIGWVSHVDDARDHTMRLQRGQHAEPTELEARDVMTTLEKIKANYPELVREYGTLVYDRPKGRLAVSLSVNGTHADLQGQAWNWADQLGGDPLERGWSITH